MTHKIYTHLQIWVWKWSVVKRLQKCFKGEHKFGVALATQSVNIVMLILQITGHYQEVGEDLVTDLQEEVIISGSH